MAAPVTHGVQAVVMRGQIAERFDADCLHLPIEARPAAEGKRAPIKESPAVEVAGLVGTLIGDTAVCGETAENGTSDGSVAWIVRSSGHLKRKKSPLGERG